MSRFSVVNRERGVRDIVFRNRRSLGPGGMMYDLYVGDEKLGMVSRLRADRGWDVYSYYRLNRPDTDPGRVAANRMRSADGFRTRWDAAKYLIRHWEMWE